MTAEMEMRPLSDTPLKVSTICLGTMGFGNPIAEFEAVRLVHWAIERGINFIDTADIYEGYDRYPGSPGGVAEDILGRALQGRRESVIVTTKVGNSTGGDGYKGGGLGRAHIIHQIDLSLRRMRTDYVDIYELHLDDAQTPLSETIGVMADLIAVGKVRHWGFSNFDGERVEEIISICEANGFPRPVVSQAPYSWLDRDVEVGHLPVCLENGVSVTPFRCLGGGLLTGKYRRGQSLPPDSRAVEHAAWSVELDAPLFDRLEAFEREARDAAIEPAQYAVKWVLDRPGVCSVVLGVKSIEQMESLLPG